MNPPEQQQCMGFRILRHDHETDVIHYDIPSINKAFRSFYPKRKHYYQISMMEYFTVTARHSDTDVPSSENPPTNNSFDEDFKRFLNKDLYERYMTSSGKWNCNRLCCAMEHFSLLKDKLNWDVLEDLTLVIDNFRAHEFDWLFWVELLQHIPIKKCSLHIRHNRHFQEIGSDPQLKWGFLPVVVYNIINQCCSFVENVFLHFPHGIYISRKNLDLNILTIPITEPGEVMPGFKSFLQFFCPYVIPDNHGSRGFRDFLKLWIYLRFCFPTKHFDCIRILNHVVYSKKTNNEEEMIDYTDLSTGGDGIQSFEEFHLANVKMLKEENKGFTEIVFIAHTEHSVPARNESTEFKLDDYILALWFSMRFGYTDSIVYELLEKIEQIGIPMIKTPQMRDWIRREWPLEFLSVLKNLKLLDNSFHDVDLDSMWSFVSRYLPKKHETSHSFFKFD